MSQVCQPLFDYMARIGAERCNFRRWQIKEHKGQYYFEKAYITVNRDGSISCPKEYAPTEKEAVAIKAEWDEAQLPKVITAADTRGIKLTTLKSVLYKFYDDSGNLVFVQERCNPKAYIPWTYWSDGQWRNMHPDDRYPFWRPFPRRKTGKIMIHEGCKAADAANNMTEDHPWFAEFSQYEHWGIIGGALAVNRADYAMLRKEQATDVVYVCDNDWPGRSVLQEVSRHYGGKLTGVVFDPQFPASWDCADPLPEKFFDKGLYIGPSFNEYKKPATFATELIYPESGKGKPTPIMRKQFLEEWIHCVTPECFLHRDWPAKIYTTPEFNNVIKPYSHVSQTSGLVMRDDASKGYALKYNPARESGIYVSEEGLCVNTHQPTNIRPMPGSIRPFMDFMEHLIPDEKERNELLRWCATLIAHPEIKMQYGVLLVSETQGVGKSTLGEKILGPLVGMLNYSTPTEEQIVDGNYNYWIAHKRLAVIHEIYAGQSSRAYNKLKSVITDKHIQVQKKYMADYTIENWLHVFACSNSMRALKLSLDDRRWFVPTVSSDKRSEEYWIKFHDWLGRAGLGIIMKWAQGFQQIILPGQQPPNTKAKDEIVVGAYSPGQIVVNDVLHAIHEEFVTEKGERIIITDKSLQDLIVHAVYSGNRSDRLERPLTLRNVAKAQKNGDSRPIWHVNETRVRVKAWNETLSYPMLICSRPEDAKKTPNDLAAEGLKPFDVVGYWSKHQKM